MPLAATELPPADPASRTRQRELADAAEADAEHQCTLRNKANERTARREGFSERGPDPEDVLNVARSTISASEYALPWHGTLRSEWLDFRLTNWLAPHTHHPRLHSWPIGHAHAHVHAHVSRYWGEMDEHEVRWNYGTWES